MSKLPKSMFFLLILLQCVLHGLSETCPHPEDISPCVCVYKESTLDIEVVCKSGNLTQVDEAFHHLHEKKIKQITLAGLKLGRLPSILFYGLHVERLLITSCQLEGIADADHKPAFVGLENSLNVLKINYCFKGANQLNTINLAHLKQLKELELSYNNISKVDNNWFKKGPYSLEKLLMYSNGITSLGDRAFQSLVNLHQLAISKFSFKTFLRTMIPNPAKSLEYLTLMFGNLFSLPDNAFAGMPSLGSVSFVNNSLTRLPSVTWSSVWQQLRSADLSGNPLDCGSNIEWTFPVKRPRDLKGNCSSPSSRKGLQLKDLIDSSKA